MISWARITPFLVIFIIHNYLLVYQLLIGHKPKRYIISAVILLIIFGSFQYAGFRHRAELMRERNHIERPHLPPPPPPPPPPSMARGHMFIPTPALMNTIIALMMFGVNMAIVLLFKHQREQEKIKALETARLQHELKYLKAQINPHFFMNTLNNIHGTVEVDPAKAQEMILELSKMMRYVLYEGKDKVVPLSSEIGFIHCYTSLMKRRYPENKVKISMDLPESTPGNMTVAPLLFMSFIENAFKHGISYKRASEISISLKVENEMIHFICINTKPEKNEKQHMEGGVGLSNTRRRLELLYEDRYTLDITENDEKFTVNLIIPDLI